MSSIITNTLSNGLTLIIEPMTGVRSAAVTWLLSAGCAMDPDDRLGMSTMHAELMLRGAGDLKSRAQADAFDVLGASRSAESGTHHLRLSSTMLGDRVLNALPLLVDMVRCPRFDEDAIEPVRDLALQSLASLADDPQERASIACRARHFPAPLNRSHYGTEDGLTALTRDELMEGWRTRARPGGSILAIAGAVDATAVIDRVASLLQGWEGSSSEPTISGPPPRGYAHAADETNQVQIIVMYDAPPEADATSMLERVAVNVLSGGMASRLFTEVREKRGLCYSVSAGYGSNRTQARVLAYVGTTPDKAQDSLDVLFAELRRIYSPAGAVTREEFDRAKVSMKASVVFAGESTSARAGSLAADQHRLGRPRSLSQLEEQIDAVTLDDLNAYLATRHMGTPTIQTLGPRPLNPPRV